MQQGIFEEELAHLLGLEGPYSNHVNDRGGPTAFGVTEAVARENGYAGDMRDYPLVEAAKVYRKIWNRLLLDQVSDLSRLVASEIFDTAVNCGDGNAIMFLQRSLNAFNAGPRYSAVAIDGAVGAATIHALAEYLAWRGKVGETVLLKAMNSCQAEYYIRITEKRPQNRDFVFGWINQRVAL